MKIIKAFLVGLMLLISLTLISAKPGSGNFENFYNFTTKNPVYTTSVAFKYPPGTYFILSSIAKQFPPQKNQLFRTQSVFTIFKIALFTGFILTFLSLYYLVKSNPRYFKVSSVLDLAVIYFSSLALTFTAIGLSFWEIWAAPFLLISLSFLIKRKLLIAITFYIVALSFSLSLPLLLPLLTAFYLKSDQKLNFLLLAVCLVFPSLLIFGGQQNPNRIISHLYSLPWLVDHALQLFYGTKMSSPIINQFSYIAIAGFATSSYILLQRLRYIYSNSQTFLLNGFFCFYLLAILLIPDFFAGNIIFLILANILLFINKPKEVHRLQLILFNVLAFIPLFLSMGITGVSNLKGQYYDIFQIILAISSIIFFMYYFFLIYKIKPERTFISRLKISLILIIILFNISLFPNPGSPDHVAWTEYAIASIEYVNPFRAYNEVILQYPPLSIVIISFFSHLWKAVIGISPDYKLAVKLSVLVFYLLTILAYFKFSFINQTAKRLKPLDKLVAIVTIFSLTIQTQGFADVNIYVMPSAVAAIFFLFKRNYFLSGLLMGLTVSIKWQPMILVPLFFFTAFDLKKGVRPALRQTALFVSGFLIIPIISWMLVFIQPNSFITLNRSFLFFLQGAAALSGQALNLNWIVTYVMHIFEYNGVETLQHLEGLNRQIGTTSSPVIFQGFLFYLASFIIFIKYWLYQKKEILYFLSASVMIFFSHFMLNKSAYEKHLFYTVILMLLLYLVRPTKISHKLLILFDVMVAINLVLFYGITGSRDIVALIFGIDVTVIFASVFLLIYLWILYRYFKHGDLTT